MTKSIKICYIILIQIIFAYCFQNGIAQSLIQVAFLPTEKDYNFDIIDLYGAMSNGFVLTGNYIFFNNKDHENGMIKWSFKSDPFCSHAVLYNDFIGENLKSNSEFIVNNENQLFDISDSKIFDFSAKSGDVPLNSVFKTDITDYEILFFTVSENWPIFYSLNILDLQNKKNIKYNMNYLKSFNNNRVYCEDIKAVKKNIIEILTSENIHVSPAGNPEFAGFYVIWKYQENKVIKKIKLSDQFSRIIGKDPFGNIYLSRGYSWGSSIISADFKDHKEFISPSDLNKYKFMKNNKLYSQYEFYGDIILYYFDKNFDLYMNVKTEKGLYFFKVNYWEELNNLYSNKNKEELRIIRNTVFAKYGKIFKSKDLQDYFSKQYWYNPDDQYSDEILNENDKKAVEMVLELEK